MKKRLTKSNDKALCGVCAGFAEYLNMDPTVVRILYALLSLCSAGFPGTLLYIVCAFVMPKPEY